MTSSEFQECIKHLLCMTKADFDRVFGSDHFWFKFRETYGRDGARFICYLDNRNMGLLMKEFRKHIEEFQNALRGKE